MSCEQGHKISQQRFMQIRVDFVKHVDDIRSFLDYAVPSGLLTKGHENRIMSERNPDDQTRQLHDYIYKKLPYDSDKLMSALKESKHFKIFDLLDEPSVYPMKFKPHGRVILINNVKFPVGSKYNERLGSEKDVEGIRELFKAFNFDVQLYSNKTAEDMKRIIEKASKESTAREDCFVMFLMSHGVRGSIIGTDGKELSYSTINTILKESYELKDKPKLIYVNTCQFKHEKDNVPKGTDASSTKENTCRSETQVKVDAECSSAVESNSEKEYIGQYFNVPDLYVTFATVPEGLAYRTEASGSFFIKSLISVYERNKDRCDISSLSLDINSEVSKECKEINMDQVSSCYSTLKRKVILRATD
ncbi:caspase-8-like isoform X3 [Octopus sinensis]|uniref:Caspase-8-like isoform X3 n=1 Tax=Octopus sinensis TaxID=2607531 RepID=A0A7E6FRF3_9MOLL|nr:caspase-8-like isoform X3 [Octopus sinensis]